MAVLGHGRRGDGPERVLVLHGESGDHQDFDPIGPYLDGQAFTFVFADLRGHGRSRDLPGRYDLTEAAADVLVLADHLGWERFHLVGHGLSSLVVQQVAADRPDRVVSLVLVAPVAPTGRASAPDEPTPDDVGFAREEARLGPAWEAFLRSRKSAAARPEAAEAYRRALATEDVVGAVPRATPVLAIVGALDEPAFTAERVRDALAPHYTDVVVDEFGDAGHAPMLECPVRFASAVQWFVDGHPSAPTPNPPEPRWPEILDAKDTELGLLALRRQPLPDGRMVTEITLDHRFLMSSVTADSERQLAELAIAMHGGDDLEVWVGGLGLGHTAHAALATGKARRVEVVELLPTVVGWMRDGLVPLSGELLADPRFDITLGDAYALLSGPPARPLDVILVDVDHSPDDPLGTWPNPFYAVPNLRHARAHLAPGGVLAVWSGAPDVTFVEALREVFDDVRPVAVSFANALDGEVETNLVFLAR